jgi:hypothetical protein
MSSTKVASPSAVVAAHVIAIRLPSVGNHPACTPASIVPELAAPAAVPVAAAKLERAARGNGAIW